MLERPSRQLLKLIVPSNMIGAGFIAENTGGAGVGLTKPKAKRNLK
jgi:hypothetical protein